MSKRALNILLYILIGVAVLSLLVAFFRPVTSSRPLHDLSALIDDARQSRVQRIEVDGDLLEVTLKDGTNYKTRKETGVSVVTLLADAGVDVSAIEIAVDPHVTEDWVGLFVQFLPLIAFTTIAVAVIRRFYPGQ
jgi:ATP-dependent Zn protease